MQTSTTIQAWIDQQLTNNPPRAKSLVMTVFGDAIAPHGGTIWLGSLISLMSHFGINVKVDSDPSSSSPIGLLLC